MKRILILLILCLALHPIHLDASAAFDQITSMGPTSTSPISGTHTPVGTPSGVLLIIFDNYTTAPTTGTPTYGGVNCTQVTGGSIAEPSFSQDRVQAYFLASGVPSGAQTVSASWSGGSGNSRRMLVYTVTGTDSSSFSDSATTNSGSGTSDSPSVSVTTQAGSLIIDGSTQVIVPSDATFSVKSGQTQRFNVQGGSNNSWLSSSKAETVSPTVMDWNNLAAPLSVFSWASVGVNIQQAAAGGSFKPYSLPLTGVGQ